MGPMDNDDFFAELKRDFLQEASDLLQKSESHFLEFEKNPRDTQLTDEISRLFHNLKGSGQAVGLDEFSHFAHKSEDLIVAIKSQELAMNSSLIDTLITCNDLLSEGVKRLSSGQELHDMFTEHLARIETFLRKRNQEEPGQISEPNQNQNDISLMQTELNDREGTSTLPTLNVANEDTYLKIPSERVEYIVNGFGELAAQITKIGSLADSISSEKRMDFQETFNQIYKAVWGMQRQTLRLKMVRLKSLFQRMQRVAREASKATSKDVTFTLEGVDQELDKTIIDALIDPLTHMVRNAIDHGIENNSDERIQLGKPASGHIKLKAYQKSGVFCIELIDDGRGMDPEVICRKARSKGIIGPLDNPTKEEALNLIFSPGFSTKDNVSELSGRGVGMDVVKKMITALKGQWKISSEVNKGTKFTIQLPLSLSLFNGTIVKSGDHKFIINNSEILEVLNIKNQRVETINKEPIVLLPNGATPLIKINEFLNINENELFDHSNDQNFSFKSSINETQKTESEIGNVAILTLHDNRIFAISVDEILDTENILLKKHDKVLQKNRFFSGGAITKDGQLKYVLNLSYIAEHYQRCA